MDTTASSDLYILFCSLDLDCRFLQTRKNSFAAQLDDPVSTMLDSNWDEKNRNNWLEPVTRVLAGRVHVIQEWPDKYSIEF